MKESIIEQVNKCVSLIKRMGENIDTSSYSLYANNFHPPFTIEEGLIKSYPIDRVISFIGKAFNFKRNDEKISISSIIGKEPSYSGEIYKENDTPNECDRIIIKKNKNFSSQEKLDYYMKKYGWFLSRIDDGDKLTYEKKFDEFATVFQLINYGITELYHVTLKNNVKNIFKKGLKPKSADNKEGYMNSERAYFFIEEPDSEKQMIVGNNDQCVLKINLNMINQTNKFYFDPRMENALYTYEPIQKEAIQIIN